MCERLVIGEACRGTCYVVEENVVHAVKRSPGADLCFRGRQGDSCLSRVDVTDHRPALGLNIAHSRGVGRAQSRARPGTDIGDDVRGKGGRPGSSEGGPQWARSRVLVGGDEP